MDSEQEYIDTHFHVWELERFQYPWPTPDMLIYRNFYPCQLWTAMQSTPVRHGIFVQCLNGSKEEAEWVIDMASRHTFIKGVVAGLDLTSLKLEEVIDSLKTCGLLKGVRHILDNEKDDWITRDDVSRGLNILANHALTYDLLVRPRHLKFVPQVVEEHPDLKFVIDHIAKPDFTKGMMMDDWKVDMAAIARYPNVFCKISGLISEQKSGTWRDIDFQPYINHVLDVFTPDRCLFGSDWPVFGMVEASYNENFSLIQRLLLHLEYTEQQKIFRQNAIKLYNINLN